MQVDNNLVLLLISSFSRANYFSPVSFECFKETGGIEYTADVLWGLQLGITYTTHRTDLKDKFKEAMLATPRKVDLVCLKNRYGISSYTCSFDYYAQFDYFKVAEEKFIPRD